MMKNGKNRWQLVSDDHVWFYPPDISLSTTEIISFYHKESYESCLFFANGDSEIVARYQTQEEATMGHIELEKKYDLKRINPFDFKI